MEMRSECRNSNVTVILYNIVASVLTFKMWKLIVVRNLGEIKESERQ